MIELERQDFARARPVFRELDDELMVAAILDGYHRGRVWVDDRAEPRAALAYLSGRAFLAGEPACEAFNAALATTFAGLLPPPGAPYPRALWLFSPSEAWEVAVQGHLPGWQVTRLPLQYYVIDVPRIAPCPRIPEGFALRLVDAALVADPGLGHRAMLIDELVSCNPSIEEFLAHGFGVVALHGDDLAGYCLSENDSAGRCEVGIATREPYRRQGVATAMAVALVAEAARRGIRQVGWHCRADNVGSGATARKAGFRKVRDDVALICALQVASQKGAI